MNELRMCAPARARGRFILARVTCALLVAASPALAQQWWRPSFGTGPAVADTFLGTIRYVTSGYEWDGQRLRSRPGDRSGPTGSQLQAAAFDTGRRRIVGFFRPALLGGLAGIWEWDGGAWVQVSGPLLPGYQSGGSAVYDSQQNAVLFVINARDIYAWDGATFSTHPAANQLSGTFWCDPVYDEARNRLVLVRSPFQIYEWDGVQWHTRLPSTAPPATSQPALCYDPVRQRTVLSLGYATGGTSDLWTWDGTSWSLLAPAPFHRSHHSLAVDSNGDLVVSGGNREFPLWGEAKSGWAFDGQTWYQAFAGPGPRGSSWVSFASDTLRRRIVTHGGSYGGRYSAETWEWDGLRWQEVTTTSGPGMRSNMAGAFDPVLGRAFFFGGEGQGGGYHNDLWTWDGSTWTAASAAVSPSPRRAYNMAYDASRSRLVLYGGNVSLNDMYDTWEYDGVTWTQPPTPVQPQLRYPSTMTFDPQRGVCVLFGRGSANFVETWEWNGLQWMLRDATTGPSTGPYASTFDSTAGHVVASGWVGSYLQLWDWSGTVWTLRPGGQGPVWSSGSSTSTLFFDSVRQRFTHLAGGMDHFGAFPPAIAAAGAPCGTPRLDLIEHPVLGEADFRIELNVPDQPSAGCLFVFGLTAGSVPLAPGCALGMGAVDSSVFTVADQVGHAGIPFQLPLVSAFAGLSLFAQAFALDGASPHGFAASDSRRISVGQ